MKKTLSIVFSIATVLSFHSAQAFDCSAGSADFTLSNDSLSIVYESGASLAIKGSTSFQPPNQIFEDAAHSVTLIMANPAFPGANCANYGSALPHNERVSVCTGTLKIKGKEQVAAHCTFTH